MPLVDIIAGNRVRPPIKIVTRSSSGQAIGCGNPILSAGAQFRHKDSRDPLSRPRHGFSAIRRLSIQHETTAEVREVPHFQAEPGTVHVTTTTFAMGLRARREASVTRSLLVKLLGAAQSHQSALVVLCPSVGSVGCLFDWADDSTSTQHCGRHHEVFDKNARRDLVTWWVSADSWAETLDRGLVGTTTYSNG